MFKVSPPTIVSYLQQQGISRRPKSIAGAKPLPQGRIKLLRRLYCDERKSLAAIAIEMGFATSGSIFYWLDKAGIPPRAKQTLPSETVESLRQLYVEEQKSIAHVAEKLGVRPRTATRWLEKAGIPKRPRSCGVSVEEMRRLYIDERKSIPKVAKETGLSHWTVRRRLKQANVPIRQRRQLDESVVREIRKLFRDGVRQSELARRFGLNSTAIHSIVRNKRWRAAQ
jgi:transposase-like protein